MSDRSESIRERLGALEEELRDLEYEALAARAADPEAVDAAERRESERKYARARRAVIRAIAALRDGEDDEA